MTTPNKFNLRDYNSWLRCTNGFGSFHWSDMAGGVTGEIHYVDAGYNKVGMPDPKNIT